jgi:hypothetical protein
MDNIFKEYLNAGTQTNLEKNKKNLFFTPLNAEYSSFSQTHRKKIKKLQKKTSKFNTKAKKNTSKFTFFKKENALVSNSNLNINKSLKYDTSYKKNEQNDMNCNYTSVSKIKKKYINKLKENINSINIPKKNIIFKSLNSKDKNFSIKNNFNDDISKPKNISFIYTNTNQMINNFYKKNVKNKCFYNNKNSNTYSGIRSTIHKKANKKNNKENSNKRNNICRDDLKNEAYTKKPIFNTQSIAYIIKGKDRSKIIQEINKNNSSKLTTISSYVTNDKNELLSKSQVKDSNKKINIKKKLDFLNKNPILQKEIPLYLTTEVNENDNTQEFESKFLNYELGVSDKVSTIYDILDESIKEKEIIKKECEKSVEEIEKIAKEIYSSNIKKKPSKSKKIVNLKKNKILNNFNLNCDIDELKDGEEINDILTFTINNSSKIKEN